MSFDVWKDGRVAAATVEVPVAVLDVKDSPQLRATLHINAVPAAVVFAPDGKTLAACTRQGEIQLWDVASMKEQRTLMQPSMVLGLAFLPDSRTLVIPWYEPLDKDGQTLKLPIAMTKVKGYRGGVKLWDATSGKERGIFRRETPRGVNFIALSPDGKMLAAKEIWRENDGKDFKSGIALWDVSAGKVIRDLDISSGLMTFAPDSKTLAVSTEGVQLLDVATGQRRGKLAAAKTSLYALAFAPDGKTLAASDFQGAVHLWDVSSGEEKACLRYGDDSRFAHSLAFAPDGKTLAIGVGPRNVRVIEPSEIVLWDLATKEKRLSLRGHVHSIFSLAFNADGTLLASSAADKTIKLWDVTPRSASKR